MIKTFLIFKQSTIPDTVQKILLKLCKLQKCLLIADTLFHHHEISDVPILKAMKKGNYTTL